MATRLTRIDTSPGQQIADRLMNPAPTPKRLALARHYAELTERLLGDEETVDQKRVRFIREQHEAADAIAAALNDSPSAA